MRDGGVEDRQDSADVGRLRRDLRALHAEWEEQPPRPGSREYAHLLEAIKDATYAVIDAERQEREEAVEIGRQRRAGVVRVVATVAVAAWLGAVVVAAGGWVSRGWLVPIALYTGVSLRGWLAEPTEPVTGQGDRIRGAITVAASGVATLALLMRDPPSWQPALATVAGLAGIWSWAAGLESGLTGSTTRTTTARGTQDGPDGPDGRASPR